MIFPATYQCLAQHEFELGEHKIVPIRYNDRIKIMKWRNEQMYHLRQAEPLTIQSQENYFKNTISLLFTQEKPSQILFSYLRNDECIGYGGLVHINWVDRNAEISFVLDTKYEKSGFSFHWSTYLKLIEKVAFKELFLHKIFTYAFDLRPHLYEILEENEYNNEAILKEHCFFNMNFIDVYIHEKRNPFNLNVLQENQKELLFNWANDIDVRKNAINKDPILWESHINWFETKLNNPKSKIFIFEKNKEPLGQIRIDQMDNDMWEIDYSIANIHRGKGFGYFMTKSLIRLFPNTQFRAIVKTDNIASQKVFVKLGFKYKERANDNLIEYFLD